MRLSGTVAGTYSSSPWSMTQLISRHQGVHAVQESEESGCAILPGNAAYLEAEVVSRLEAGDHWLVYAKVNAGQVLLT